MKTTTRLLLPFIAGSIAILSACSNPVPPSLSQGSDSLSSRDEAHCEMGQEYTFSSWEELLPVLSLAVPGDEELIPSYLGSAYVISVQEVALSEESTIPAAFLTVSGVSSSALSSYETKLQSGGFQISGDGAYAFAKASPTEDLIVEYLLEEGKLAYDLRLTVYRPEFRLKSYPSDFVALLTDEKIPAMEGEAYSASFDPSGYGAVTAYGNDESSFLQYGKVLEQAGFRLKENEAAYSRYASDDGYLELLLLLTYDAYGDSALHMRIQNAWPYVYLRAVLQEDLPKLPVEPNRFSYSFVGEEGILTLYYEFSSREDHLQYSLLLERAGYALESEETVNPSDPIQARRYGKNGASVDVLYKESAQTIAIPVYGKVVQS